MKFKSTAAPVEPALNTCQVCPGGTLLLLSQFVNLHKHLSESKTIAITFRYWYLISKLDFSHIKEMVRYRTQDQAHNENDFPVPLKPKAWKTRAYAYNGN